MAKIVNANFSIPAPVTTAKKPSKQIKSLCILTIVEIIEQKKKIREKKKQESGQEKEIRD